MKNLFLIKLIVENCKNDNFKQRSIFMIFEKATTTVGNGKE
jgi:hypothetical protein